MATTDVVVPVVVPVVSPIVVPVVVASADTPTWSIPAWVIIPIGSIRISIPNVVPDTVPNVVADIVSATNIITNIIVSAAYVDPGTVDHHVVVIATSRQVDVIATSR
jgi:hypothetical protein